LLFGCEGRAWPTISSELPVVDQFLAADITAVGGLKGSEDAA